MKTKLKNAPIPFRLEDHVGPVNYQKQFEEQFQTVVQMEGAISIIEKDLIDRKLKLKWAIRTLQTFEMQAKGMDLLHKNRLRIS
jgi:hypothetical protein